MTPIAPKVTTVSSNHSEPRRLRRHRPVPTIVGTALVLATALCTLSCGPDMPVYSHFETVSPGGWTPDRMTIFEPWPADSAQASSGDFELRLCLRYRIPAPKEAMLVVEQESLSMPERRDTVTLRLLDSSGHPSGQGSRGLFTVEHTLTPRLRLSEGYSVAIHPLDTIYSATDIGLLLLPL